jgi:hypothetical protein
MVCTVLFTSKEVCERPNDVSRPSENLGTSFAYPQWRILFSTEYNVLHNDDESHGESFEAPAHRPKHMKACVDNITAPSPKRVPEHDP